MGDLGATAERRTANVAGHTVSYLECGPAGGSPVVLVHGLVSDSDTWDQAVPTLAAQGLRVIALDLLGHGRSDKPGDGYLLDDLARQLHQFFDAIGLARATVCGHSLGGALAVHFGYYFPQHVQRLVLVSAGGLGREVHLGLRAAALPIAPPLVALAMSPRLSPLYRNRLLHRALRLTPDQVVNLSRVGRALSDARSRAAFFAALRGVIAPSGQRGSFLALRYLAENVPTMVVWSEGDIVIPVAHAHATQAQLPGARLVVFPGGGHEPHRRHAAAFAVELADFVRTTPPAHLE